MKVVGKTAYCSISGSASVAEVRVVEGGEKLCAKRSL